jgi:hypothetical protein
MQEATGEETGAEPGLGWPAWAEPGLGRLDWAEPGLGRPAWADRPSLLRARFDAPFCPRCLSIYFSTAVGRHIEQIILPTPFTRKPPPQDEGESWMSSSQGSTPAEGRKQEEDSKPLA